MVGRAGEEGPAGEIIVCKYTCLLSIYLSSYVKLNLTQSKSIAATVGRINSCPICFFYILQLRTLYHKAVKITLLLGHDDRGRTSTWQSETEDSLLPEKGPGDDTMDL